MRKGFTLIELMTVILIIGILVSLGTYGYGIARQRNRDDQRKTDIASIKNYLEQYYVDNRNYPNSDTYNSVSDIVPSAKYQLSDINTNCDRFNNYSKKLLVPRYASTIPDDPINKTNISVDAARKCSISNISGIYVYQSLPINSIKTKVKPDNADIARGFYLMAKMERDTDILYPTLDLSIINSLNLTYSQNTNSSTTQNYAVTNSKND